MVLLFAAMMFSVLQLLAAVSAFVTNNNFKDSQVLHDIPQFVFDHAPLVYLYSEERYNPSDIAKYVNRFQLSTTYDMGTGLGPQKMFLRFGNSSTETGLRIQDLKSNFTVLKPLDADQSFLQVVDSNSRDVETVTIPSRECVMEMEDFDYGYPHILLGNKPNSFGYIRDSPAVLLVRDHGPESPFIDAYWFYFYGFNLGAFVMGTGPWGNHLGDWEHSIMRFRKQPGYEVSGKAVPESMWLSAHGGGFAYKFSALEKYNSNMGSKGGKRPIIFSAKGTHANYASVGQHAHDVPFFFSALSDFTDRGILWDPTKNFYAYSFTDRPLKEDSHSSDHHSDDIEFRPFRDLEMDTLGVDWLNYKGLWGNLKLPLSDKRQHVMPFQYTYIDGPTGPVGKNLERSEVCQRPYRNNNNIYWNLLRIGPGCQIRRTIKRGQGLDAERNDMVGDNCGVLLYKIRPQWLRTFFEFLTWRGLLCYFMEYFTG